MRVDVAPWELLRQRVHGKLLGTLKNELVHHRRYATRAEARALLQEYIEIFYNQQWHHSLIGFVPPALFAEFFSENTQAA